jgi:hypothetical protein
MEELNCGFRASERIANMKSIILVWTPQDPDY